MKCVAMTPSPVSLSQPVLVPVIERRPASLISSLWHKGKRLAQALARLNDEATEIHNRIEESKAKVLAQNYFHTRGF